MDQQRTKQNPVNGKLRLVSNVTISKTAHFLEESFDLREHDKLRLIEDRSFFVYLVLETGMDFPMGGFV